MGIFYFESGVGASSVRSGATFFESSSPLDLGLGMALNTVMAMNIAAPSSSMQLHLGAQARVSFNSSEQGSYSMLSLYPILRIETPLFFVGAGVSPLVWRRVGDSLGISNYNFSESTLSTLLEAGTVLPMTPEVAVVLSGAAQLGRVTEAEGAKPIRSPHPALEGTVALRFFFGGRRTTGSSSGERNWEDYPGWRYPFGNTID